MTGSRRSSASEDSITGLTESDANELLLIAGGAVDIAARLLIQGRSHVGGLIAKGEIIRMLYGDPSRRHRAYAACGHDHTPEMLGAAPDGAPDPPELVAEAIVFAIRGGEAHVLVADPPRPIVPGDNDDWGALLARQAPASGGRVHLRIDH